MLYKLCHMTETKIQAHINFFLHLSPSHMMQTLSIYIHPCHCRKIVNHSWYCPYFHKILVHPISKQKLKFRKIYMMSLCSLLKRQYHEIFNLHFFHKSIAPRALINTLKYLLILFRFRAEISEFMHSVESWLCAMQHSAEFFEFVSSKTSRYAT
jgi:hypothetical protein